MKTNIQGDFQISISVRLRVSSSMSENDSPNFLTNLLLIDAQVNEHKKKYFADLKFLKA